jgi:hypothetical protein
MIILSKTTADPDGRVILRNYQLSGDYENTARISRQKTLDGSSVLSHYGTTDTDRDFTVDCRMAPAEADIVKSFFNNAIALRISFWEGAFIGYIHRLVIQRDGVGQITFYFSEKLTS